MRTLLSFWGGWFCFKVYAHSLVSYRTNYRLIIVLTAVTLGELFPRCRFDPGFDSCQVWFHFDRYHFLSNEINCHFWQLSKLTMGKTNSTHFCNFLTAVTFWQLSILISITDGRLQWRYCQRLDVCSFPL